MSKEQIEEMVEIVKPFVSGLACGDESGACELTDCRSCKARNLVNAIIEKDYRKQIEGKWIKDEKSRTLHRCSNCGFGGYYNGVRLGKFCSNCGSKMKNGGQMIE